MNDSSSICSHSNAVNMHPADKQHRSSKKASKKLTQNHVKLEVQSPSVTVNEKLLSGDTLVSLSDFPTMHDQKQMSFESIRLWFRLFLVNDLATILVLFVWILINIALFIGQFFNYHQSRSYFYLRVLISDGLSIARGSALCLNFNCFLILFPVCRNLLSVIRYLLPKCITQSRFRRFTIRLFDQHIGFHRCVGYAICFWALLHVGAHIYNYERFITVQKEYFSLSAALNLLYLQAPESQINPFDQVDPDSIHIGLILNTVSGGTGLILCLCLLVICGSSTALIRRSFYEIFWFTHHIFIVFFICLIIHGLQGIIKAQTNLSDHNPDVCASLYRQWGINTQCLVYPRFNGSTATSWMWLCVPLFLYIVERLLRFIRSLQTVEIVDLIHHQSNVLELRLRKKLLTKPQPGQYIYLKCFSISIFEWHPFTVTSAAEENFISVHIRTIGNWTKELAHQFRMYPQDIPRLGIDGPYGSPADDVFNYDGVVLIGAGIGVTPYAAILKHIQSYAANEVRLRRVYFYWICNTTSCYEWFAEMLQQLERDLRDRENFLTYKIFLTQWSIGQARAVIKNNTDERDIWTGLESKTFYGRPNFEVDFQRIINEDWGINEKRDVGVFVCGPKPLTKQLQRLCIKLNEHYSNKNKIEFYLNKENF